MAVLTFYGLVSVLILWRAFKLDKADRARIAATQSPIMQDSEQKTSWDERVKWAVEYARIEVIGNFVLGVIWCLCNLAGRLRYLRRSGRNFMRGSDSCAGGSVASSRNEHHHPR
jgi:hypothetical protein